MKLAWRFYVLVPKIFGILLFSYNTLNKAQLSRAKESGSSGVLYDALRLSATSLQ
jgi:hypothetical protein